jgi:hypothetical protein
MSSDAAEKRRADLIVSVLGKDAEPFAESLASNDPSHIAAVKPTGNITQATLDRATFVSNLAGIIDNDQVVIAIGKDPSVSSVRDVALNYDKDRLSKLLPSKPSVHTSPKLSR